MIELSEKLKKLRAESNMFQKTVAEAINVKQNTLSQFENGTARPSYEVLVKLADLYDVTTDYLLGRTDY